jgi:hypothetical protein
MEQKQVWTTNLLRLEIEKGVEHYNLGVCWVGVLQWKECGILKCTYNATWARGVWCQKMLSNENYNFYAQHVKL